MKLRRFDSRDTAEVMAIQAACPELAPWTRHDYNQVADGGMDGWVVEAESQIAGFIVARHVSGEMEILNLAVRAEHRRCGYGNALLKAAIDRGRSAGATRAFLEVRGSNLAALHFYAGYGFEVTGRRPRYYTAPIEDAIILTATIVPAQSSHSPGA